MAITNFIILGKMLLKRLTYWEEVFKQIKFPKNM